MCEEFEDSHIVRCTTHEHSIVPERCDAPLHITWWAPTVDRSISLQATLALHSTSVVTPVLLSALRAKAPRPPIVLFPQLDSPPCS